MKTQSVSCSICNSNDAVEIFPSGKAQIHRIVKCKKCDLMYANPQTDNVSAVEQNYTLNSKYSDGAELLKDFTPEKHQYLKKQFLQINDYQNILKFIDNDKKGIMMEIGSYAGIFLKQAKEKGWEVIGVEPLEIPALYSEKIGVSVIRKYFEDIEIEPNSLDVIVATHVIEHIKNPNLFLDKVFSSLKHGGKLILETPTYDSIMFKLLKHRERSVRCNGHLFFFTKKTLSDLLKKNGFNILRHDYVGRTLTLDRFLYNLGVITGSKNMFSKISKKLQLNQFVIRVNINDMQRIYCIKP